MDELIRKTLFKPYLSLSKQTYGNQSDSLQECQRVIVLHEGPSPTLAYFEHAIKSKFPDVEYRRQDTTTLSNMVISEGDAIVIIRFLSPSWQQQIERDIAKLSHVIYFMDDDLFDPSALTALPKPYRKKILRRSAAQHRWITQHCDDIWVSTVYLAKKYAHLNPEVVEAKPSSLLLEPMQSVKIAYHGSSSHRDEKYWLRHVVEGVLQRCPSATFEIFGEHDIYKHYRDLPRVTVLHPMSWDNYLAYTRVQRIDIGLAPLLGSAFNAARGPIKYYDFVRMGAIGIYSNCAPYNNIIEQNTNGLLLENDVDLWIRAIEVLVASPDKRIELSKNAKVHAYALID